MIQGVFRFFARLVFFFAPTGFVLNAQEAATAAVPVSVGSDPATQAVAVIATDAAPAQASATDLASHAVNLLLEAFGIGGAGNTWQHYLVAGLVLVVSFLFRKALTRAVFGGLRRVTARTATTLDDELFVALERPVAAFVAVFGAVVAVKVLTFTPDTEAARIYLQTVAFAVVTLWLFLKAFDTIIDHLHATAKRRAMSVAAFMPWIKKTLFTLILIFGVLLVAQRLGADVKAFLAGLGIGGLAFALAAQDTLANVFGSVVVAVDQPFRVGEFVHIGANQGVVEDIGLRSTKLRSPDRTLIAIPNKTVANEVINNFGRMPQRRVLQTIGVTYGSRREQVDGLVGDIREMLRATPEVHPATILVHFLNFGASSLDIQIIYFSADPDGIKTMDLRHKVNLELMRLVEARGLGFAFPTQTIEFAGAIARRLAEGRAGAAEER